MATWEDRLDRVMSGHSTFRVVICIVSAITMFLLAPLELWEDLDDTPSLVAISSMVYLLLDPLFLYAPLIDWDTKCLVLDNRLKIAAPIFRSWGDLHYLFRIYIRLKDGWRKSPTLKEMLGLASDTVSVLPIPQVAILIFLPKMRGSNSLKTMKVLNSLIVLQYLPRVYPLYRLCKNGNTRNIGVRGPKSPNIIFLNIYGYIIASHIFGAFWYFFSIQRAIECWGHACRIENRCEFSTSCAQNSYRNITLLENLCPINPPDKQVFDFGIFRDALQFGMLGSTNFPQKYLRCFSWGLRNLSSFGSNLNDTSAYGWENLFVVLISISGLLLFMYLLGHVQTLMQKVNKSKTILQKMEMTIGPKIRSILYKYGLSNEMETKIKLAVKEKLIEDENHIVENMFSILSLKEAKSFAADMKYTLFLYKLKKVDGLKDKGEDVLGKICEHLEPMIYNEGSYIIREGEPLDMMFFVTWGNVLTYATNNGGSNGSSGINQLEKEQDYLYGEELLTWAEGPSSKLCNLPISPITVKSHKKVEIFALKAADLQSHFNMDNTTLTVLNDTVS